MKTLTATDKSVRNRTQRATLKGSIIEIKNNVGTRKVYSYKIQFDDWYAISKLGNYDYNKMEFIKGQVSKLGELQDEPDINQRIIESQVKAIEKLLAGMIPEAIA